ncbi:MAG: phage holin family protein [Syntrophomonas sp.]
MRVVIIYLSNLLALGLSSWLLFPEPFIDIPGLLLAALILTALNYLLRPLLMVITLPLNLLTLGLFMLLINAWMVMLADAIVTSWQMPGFWASLFAGTLVLIFNNIARSIARSTESQLEI